MNALCNEPITNRDPRYAGVMAELETDDAREDFLAYQRANFMRLAQVFIAARSEEFETFTWEMYAEAKAYGLRIQAISNEQRPEAAP